MSPLNNTSPFFFGRSFELLHLYWSSGLGLGLKFTPHIFNEIRVRALCRPFSNGHLSLLEVGFHQKWSKRALSCRKKVLEVSFQNFHISFMIPSTLRTFLNPDALKKSSQHNIPSSMFHCGNIALWVVCLSLLFQNINSVSVAKKLCFFQYAFFLQMSFANFSLAYRCIFIGGVLLHLQPRIPVQV